MRKTLQIAVPALLALIVLNIGLAHHNIWPTLMVRATTELSLELIVLLTTLALSAAGGIRIGARAQWLLAALVLLFVIGRYVDVTAPALFGRRIDLYWDSQH
ncbi:MAG: sulfatase-like hydrolase/transferase, partial [Alphaproteobacteria bacterium]